MRGSCDEGHTKATWDACKIESCGLIDRGYGWITYLRIVRSLIREISKFEPNLVYAGQEIGDAIRSGVNNDAPRGRLIQGSEIKRIIPEIAKQTILVISFGLENVITLSAVDEFVAGTTLNNVVTKIAVTTSEPSNPNTVSSP